MPKKYDLAIVLVNYNGGKWLDQTLNTLNKFYLQQTELKVQTWLVDNASSDDSFARAKKKYSWIKTLQAEKNLGFAAGNNLALREILEAGDTRHIMLLNTDTELDQRSNVDHLVEYLDTHPEVGVITPQVVLSDGRLDPACHRGEPTLWASLTYFTGLEKLFPTSRRFSQYHQGYQDLSQVHTIDACSGAAMVIRVSAITKVGLLDEQFFMYAEDLDWCKRFREAGYSIVYYPAVTVVHHKHKSGIGAQTSTTAKKTKHHFYDTMLQYFDKHYKLEYPSVVRRIIQLALTVKKRL